LPKDRDTFEKEFEERFTTWDADHSGNVDIKQIHSLQQVAPPSGGAKDKTVTTSANKKGMDLHNVPKSCIEWIQELASKKKEVARTGGGSPKAKAAPKK